LASKGYKVIGVDLDNEKTRLVNSGKAPFFEPLLEELMRRYGGNLVATTDYNTAIGESSTTFIVVNTPSEPDGSFSSRYLQSASSKIGEGLRYKSEYHSVVVTSTVLPGTTRNVVKTLIEENSKKKCGIDFGLCYNPEFIALGDVIRGLSHPDFVLIGEFDARSGDLTESIYDDLCENKPPVARMSIENAELTKIALNSYVTMKISFANALAELCERLPGGDIDEVTSALGLDRRIGAAYLRGGLAFGGPCFPRDNKAFGFTARQLGCEAKLSEATDATNLHQTSRWVLLIDSKVSRHSKIAILGVTYKPNTEVVEASPALELAGGLLRLGHQVNLYDPAGLATAKSVLGVGPFYHQSLRDCLLNADACILATPWEHFASLTPSDFVGTMKNPMIFDCWRILDNSRFQKHGQITYVRLGHNDTDPASDLARVEVLELGATSPAPS
jgi:UDPglucose 6-dehydrogenase